MLSRGTVGFAMAAAAALLVFALLPDRDLLPTDTPRTNRFEKGGAVSLGLVRRRGDIVTENPIEFLDGDRFRLLVSSPYDVGVPAEIVVFQGDKVFFPYPSSLNIAPGNQVGLPGSIRLTGDAPCAVCIVAGKELPARDDLSSEGIESLPESAVCITLVADSE